MKDTACIAIDLGATSGRVILVKMKHGRLETEILNRFPNVIKEIDGRCYWDIYSLFFKAKYEDGILKLSVPKKEQKKVETTKHIAIEG